MRYRLGAALIALLLPGATPNAAQADPGDVRWRFEMATGVSRSEVSVGPDGTIYASDNVNFYALNPDGSVRWTITGQFPGLASSASIDFQADGTILTGADNAVVALNPDGSVKWTYTFEVSDLNSHLQVGPSVGPDGNIYAVTGVGDGGVGLGAFSLTPEGQLRWSDQGEPLLAPINAASAGRVFFTAGRMIFPFRTVQNGGAIVYGYDFDGHQTLYVDFTCTGIPRTDSLNRLLITSACGIEAMEQDGNESYWTVQFGAVNLAPALGTDATAYSAGWFGDVNAINPDGSIQWTSNTASGAFRMLAVDQDLDWLVYSGADNFGVPDFVAGVSTVDGSLLWRHDLMTVDGHNELVWTQIAPTSPDGTVVYFSTRFTSNGAPGAVYAMETAGNRPSTGVAATAEHPADAFRVFPNPSADGRFRFDVARTGSPAADLAVFDVTGRRVRTLLRDAAATDPLTWDGHGTDGARVPAGTYFARLRTLDGEESTRRITILR